MVVLTQNLTAYLETVLLAVCIAAIPYYLYRAYAIHKTEHVISVKGAGGKLFLAAVFFVVLKTQLLIPSGVQPYTHDGEVGVFVVPNIFWLNERVELELRYDPEIGSRLWMKEGEQGFYPFFREPGAY